MNTGRNFSQRIGADNPRSTSERITNGRALGMPALEGQTQKEKAKQTEKE